MVTVHQFSICELPHTAKQCLTQSINDTLSGYRSFAKQEVLTGCGDILLGRVKAAAAFVFAGASFVPILGMAIVGNPCFLGAVVVLNAASFLPFIGSLESINTLTQDCNDLIWPVVRVNLIALPVIFLFLTTSAVNFFLPGVLKEENPCFPAIHWLVEPLGPMQTKKVELSDGSYSCEGFTHNPSLLEFAEEYLRGLSYRNEITETIQTNMIHKIRHEY